ncbi:MAG: MFS transporter [Microvirga sp.]|jgi:predicted MFS family arabinose efflux permease|nr:MFS transporter [Beijerinckiaceae bacterium]
MSSFSRLLAAGGAAHFADQLATAALPLTAVIVLGAGPGTVGTLVALQGLAWLLASLPAGVLVDRVPKGLLIALSQAVAGLAFAAATVAATAGSGTALAAACFIGASGAVILVLTALALVPALVPAAALAAANARLELVRAVATLAAPVAVGLMADAVTPALGFALAAIASAAAAFIAFGLRAPSSPGPARAPLADAIREGARFALRHELLRGIALCAVFWNFAFFALLAVAVPFCLTRVGLDAKGTGLAQGGYGLGLILGAAAAAAIVRRFEPRVILVAGPALSMAAPVLLFLAARGGGLPAAAAAFFFVGFGPMLWLICQTSIRQLVTPPDLIGRVAATIQVAIYGVRPLGAFAGGWVGALFGLDAALVLVLAAFGLSLAVPLVSALGRLRAMPENVGLSPAGC